MTFTEKKHLMLELGVPERSATAYLQEESEHWAVLPAFRLLKPLSDSLEFHRGPYQQVIKARIQDGTLSTCMPQVAPLIEAGVTPECLERFVYDLLLETYERLLYQLDDPSGSEISEVFCDEAFSQCSQARLMEVDADGHPTGRQLIEVHGKIPFSDLY